MERKILFGTGTSRTGGAMLSNLLSVHRDILITTDFVHFFRFIYNKYSPINKPHNQFKLVHEMCLRMKYRRQIDLSPKEILSYFKHVNSYSDAIYALSDFILSIDCIHPPGEEPNSNIFFDSFITENLFSISNNLKADLDTKFNLDAFFT